VQVLMNMCIDVLYMCREKSELLNDVSAVVCPDVPHIDVNTAAAKVVCFACAQHSLLAGLLMNQTCLGNDDLELDKKFDEGVMRSRSTDNWEGCICVYI
jgi:hypothetical protein